MILRNTREPYNEVGPFDPDTETGANWIEYYKLHLYVEVGAPAPRGKKASELPPSDLRDLAASISEGAKE